MSVYEDIISKINQGKRQFAVLIDPEKSERTHLEVLLEVAVQKNVDMILFGGSTDMTSSKSALKEIKQLINKPIVLFPGNISQIDTNVDAVFLLSLLSGRNSDFLIGNHVKAVPLLKGLEVIPVAYLLIDGGRSSAIQKVTKTKPMPVDNVEAIVNTAIAGEMLGHKLVYLEAGSGALIPVNKDIISAVRSSISIPLVVGGGLRSADAIAQAYEAGADLVVVGNALEENPLILEDLLESC